MISEKEIIEFQKHIDEFTKIIGQSKNSQTFLKLLVNNLNPAMPNHDRLVELIKNQAITAAVPQLIDSLIKAEDDHTSEWRIYSTSDLSKFFQVSQTTINKWINQNRFIGISREPNKHVRINENVEWVSSIGTKIKINEIVEQYEKHHNNPPELTKEEQRDEILLEIEALEKRYGGNLDEKFKNKKELSFDEERDFGAWTHFSKMLEDLNG